MQSLNLRRIHRSLTLAALTKQFQTLLAALLREIHADQGVELINAGVSGDKVTDIQARLKKDVLARKPIVVVIHIGINDVWRGKDGTPRDRYEAGLRDLVARIGKEDAQTAAMTRSKGSSRARRSCSKSAGRRR